MPLSMVVGGVVLAAGFERLSSPLRAEALMAEQRLTVEPRYRVYDDDCGYYVEVRTDPDGLGCVQCVYNEGKANDADQPMGAISPALAIKVAECMVKIANFLEEHPL